MEWDKECLSKLKMVLRRGFLFKKTHVKKRKKCNVVKSTSLESTVLLGKPSNP